jgi:hypothetical protein
MRFLPAFLLVAGVAVSAQGREAPEPKQPAEPAVQRIVVEDEGARIEELRVRGQVQRITVKPKNAREYEIVAPVGGRDPSQNRANQQPGAGGQRVWKLFNF